MLWRLPGKALVRFEYPANSQKRCYIRLSMAFAHFLSRFYNLTIRSTRTRRKQYFLNFLAMFWNYKGSGRCPRMNRRVYWQGGDTVCRFPLKLQKIHMILILERWSRITIKIRCSPCRTTWSVSVKAAIWSPVSTWISTIQLERFFPSPSSA